MEQNSGTGQKNDIPSPIDQRQDARFAVKSLERHTVRVVLGHTEIPSECIDYSPFGLGLRFKLNSELPFFSIGESVDLDCDFAGSKFRARGTVANTRVERLPEGQFVRLGIALSRSAEVVRPAHLKRRYDRIQMEESVSPLAIISDDLRFGEAVFAKMTDISRGGLRLSIDRRPLPFVEKQRHWIQVVLPIFGICRIFCRIAYVRRDESENRYVVGFEFVDGGEDANLSLIEDWLFYTNCWLTVADIRGAGFLLSHLSENDEKYRVLLSVSSYDEKTFETFSGPMFQSKNDSLRQHVDTSESLSSSTEMKADKELFDFSVRYEIDVLRLLAEVDNTTGVLYLHRIDQTQLHLRRGVTIATWKAIFVFLYTNRFSELRISKEYVTAEFLNESLLRRSAVEKNGFVCFTLEQLLGDSRIAFWIWRRLYPEMKLKGEWQIPPAVSFLRRCFLVVSGLA